MDKKKMVKEWKKKSLFTFEGLINCVIQMTTLCVSDKLNFSSHYGNLSVQLL